MPTMVTGAWRGASRTVIVALNGRAFASDADWAPYVTLVREALVADPRLERTYSLAFSDGGSPSATQRREIVEVCAGARAVGAIISGSRLVRGVGTALSWFMPEVKWFAPEDYPRALAHLGVPPADEPSLWRTIVELDRRMGLELLRQLTRPATAGR